jgi:hypothetical protein
MFFLFSLILLFFINSSYSITISPNKQTGFGLPCSNRTWSRYNSTISAATRQFALDAKLGPLPVFNDTIYLNGVYNRVESDKMMVSLYERLSDLVRVECVEYKGEYIETIENYLNNIVSAKSWASSAHDPAFDYYYGRAYWIELVSSTIFIFKFFLLLKHSNLTSNNS